MRMMDQSIHDRISEGGIAHAFVPVFDGHLTGEQRGATETRSGVHWISEVISAAFGPRVLVETGSVLRNSVATDNICLDHMAGISISEDRLTGRPSISLSVLADEASRSAFLQAWDSLIAESPSTG